MPGLGVKKTAFNTLNLSNINDFFPFCNFKKLGCTRSKLACFCERKSKYKSIF